MLRRPRIETQINHERWLVSYADFITLLFAFFVVMYSVSQVNENKYRTLSATLQAAFSGESVLEAEDSPQSVSANDDVDEMNLGELGDIAGQLESLFEPGMEREGVMIRGNEHWLEVELNANMLFASGSEILNKNAEELLSALADTLSVYDNAIAIEGHTDDLPINNEKYASNWELASARAVSVVSLLAYQGIAPERLSAEGYGEYRPVVANDSEQGRSRNRRVVIKVSDSGSPESLSADNPMDEPLIDDTQTRRQPVRNGVSVSEPPPLLKSQQNETISPVRLRGGGLLFSSDPDLPRVNPVVRDDSEEASTE